MDNNFSDSILQSSDSIIPSTSYSNSGSEGGFFDGLKNINITTWLLIILILAFLGFNIFAYLAKGTQDISNAFAPILHKIFGVTTLVASQAVDVSAEGAKEVVSETADALNKGLTAVQDITPNGAQSSVKGQQINKEQQIDDVQQATLNKALNSSESQQPHEDYQANEASSSVHNAGKSGWCYIGMDRGFRTCGEVGVNDTCMSGDIFPSQEICMNPRLRA